MNNLEEYLTVKAEGFAKDLSGQNVDISQLRKFYGEFKMLERKLIEKRPGEEDFASEFLPLIKFVKSKIAYSAGRKSQNKILIPPIYKEHMDREIDSIKTQGDFKNFLMHYEAVIGYFTFFASQRSQREEDIRKAHQSHGRPGSGPHGRR